MTLTHFFREKSQNLANFQLKTHYSIEYLSLIENLCYILISECKNSREVRIRLTPICERKQPFFHTKKLSASIALSFFSFPASFYHLNGMPPIFSETILVKLSVIIIFYWPAIQPFFRRPFLVQLLEAFVHGHFSEYLRFPLCCI